MLMNHTLQHQQRTQVACAGEIYNMADVRGRDGQVARLALVKLADGSLVTAHVCSEEALRLGDVVELMEESRAGLPQAYRFRKSS